VTVGVGGRVGARRASHPVVVGGALAGTLDLTAACVQAGLKGRTPFFVLQSIATGWFGRASYTHGATSAAVGLLTHYGIATAWAALYWFASRVSAPFVRHAWFYGAAYGIVVYGIMYEIVMPLSAIHRRIPRTPQDYLTGILIHIACVGVPVALVARAHTPRAEVTGH